MRIFVCLMLLMFIGLNSANAQDVEKVGLGVAVFDLQQLIEAFTSQGVGANATLTFPIHTSPEFRVEPEIGILRASEEEKNGVTETNTVTSWKIGAGIFSLNTSGDFTLYYGGRVGYTSQTWTYEAGAVDGETSTSGIYIAPAIGGEHAFSEHFSLGGEAQLMYTTTSTDIQDSNVETSLSAWGTRALVFVRVYL